LHGTQIGLLAAIDMRQSSARLFHNDTVNDSNGNIALQRESNEKDKRSLSPNLEQCARSLFHVVERRTEGKTHARREPRSATRSTFKRN
jgi:hypothetical protein